MLIRPLEPGDIDALLELFDAVAAERDSIGTEPGYDREKKRRAFEASIVSDENAPFVAIEAGRLAGFAGVYPNDEYGPTLGMLVAKPHRHRGVGRALMDTLDRWARDARVTALNLFVFPHNENAIALYRKAGYVEIERFEDDVTRQTGEVWDTILMRKTFS